MRPLPVPPIRPPLRGPVAFSEPSPDAEITLEDGLARTIEWFKRQ